VATSIIRAILALGGLFVAIAGLLPLFRGESMNTSALSKAAVLFFLALVLRPRPPRASPSGPGA
jgi:hypothetical protein